MHSLVQIGCVVVGSSLGGLLRWGVGIGFARWLGTGFPWGTLFINVTGSFILGWFSTFLTDRLAGGTTWVNAENLRLLVAVGFTGAFTTFSAFEFEANRLLTNEEWLKACLYMVGSLVLGLLALRLGMALAKT